VLRDSARRLREVAPALRERIRSIAEPASVDSGVRMFNPVIGTGNPIAPPMRIEIGEIGCRVSLLAYASGPGYALGGRGAGLAPGLTATMWH
jgi:hypothetical protein